MLVVVERGEELLKSSLISRHLDFLSLPNAQTIEPTTALDSNDWVIKPYLVRYYKYMSLTRRNCELLSSGFDKLRLSLLWNNLAKYRERRIILNRIFIYRKCHQFKILLSGVESGYPLETKMPVRDDDSSFPVQLFWVFPVIEGSNLVTLCSAYSEITSSCPNKRAVPLSDFLHTELRRNSKIRMGQKSSYEAGGPINQ